MSLAYGKIESNKQWLLQRRALWEEFFWYITRPRRLSNALGQILLMNITLVSWLEFTLVSKNLISFQGKFYLGSKSSKVGFTQNLRNAEIWGLRKYLLVPWHLRTFPLDSPWMSGGKLHPSENWEVDLLTQWEAPPNGRCCTGYCLNPTLCLPTESCNPSEKHARTKIPEAVSSPV